MTAPRHDPRPPQRDEARVAVLQAANRWKLSLARQRVPYLPPTLLGMRHIQQAVCIVRRHGLVDGLTLQRAGYRPVPPNAPGRHQLQKA